MKHGWNIDNEIWRKLPPIVSKLKWKQVPFDVIHSGQVPKSAGVYLICGHSPMINFAPFSKFYTVLYAGLSRTNINDRFTKHCQKPEENVKKAKSLYGYVTNKMAFHYANAPADVVDRIEDCLIECYGPPCNRQGGNKSVIKATLGQGQPA